MSERLSQEQEDAIKALILNAEVRAAHRRKALLVAESFPGDIRCLDCGKHYDEPPPGWWCTCKGPVSQNVGTIRVDRSNA